MTTVMQSETEGPTDERDRRAAYERLWVREIAPDLVEVYSERGVRYMIDLRTGACNCDDARFRQPEGGCKHVRRATFSLGRRPIPAGFDRDRMDPRLVEALEADR